MFFKHKYEKYMKKNGVMKGGNNNWFFWKETPNSKLFISPKYQNLHITVFNSKTNEDGDIHATFDFIMKLPENEIVNEGIISTPTANYSCWKTTIRYGSINKNTGYEYTFRLNNLKTENSPQYKGLMEIAKKNETFVMGNEFVIDAYKDFIRYSKSERDQFVKNDILTQKFEEHQNTINKYRESCQHIKNNKDEVQKEIKNMESDEQILKQHKKDVQLY